MTAKWFKNDWTLAHLLYYLSQIGYILTGVYLIMMISMLASQLKDGQLMSNQIPVRMEVEQLKQETPVQLNESKLYFSDTVEGKIGFSKTTDGSIWPVIGFYVIELSKQIILFITLFLFSKIFKTIINEEPFSEKNPIYLFTIGWILVLTPLAFQFIGLFFQSFFANLQLPEGIQILGLNSYGDGYILAGIFMIVLGYVFREGNRLYEEQRLTV